MAVCSAYRDDGVISMETSCAPTASKVLVVIRAKACYAYIIHFGCIKQHTID